MRSRLAVGEFCFLPSDQVTDPATLQRDYDKLRIAQEVAVVTDALRGQHALVAPVDLGELALGRVTDARRPRRELLDPDQLCL